MIGVLVHQYHEGHLVQFARYVNDPVAQRIILCFSKGDLLQFVELFLSKPNQLIQRTL